jgi:hypothetical protein
MPSQSCVARRSKQILGLILVNALVFLAVDYFKVQGLEKRKREAIAQCGGGSYMLGGWPLGTEYRITFPHALTAEQLDSLDVLNRLRGSVGVAFVDCDLSDDEIREAIAKLHNCRLYRVVDGRMFRLAVEKSDETE